jgi:SAM-dependent methyltransferase
MADHASLDRYNRAFYERGWRVASVVGLPGVVGASGAPGPRIEIGCGLRPRLPLADATFVEVSPSACTALRNAGARAVRAHAAALPFRDATLGEVYLFDVLEHLADDRSVVAELARVIRPGGLLVLSTPLHARLWQAYDRVVGHARRYEPAALVGMLAEAGFQVTGLAPFGLRPRSGLLGRLGLWCLIHMPERALRFEERFLRFFGPRTPVRLAAVRSPEDAIRAAAPLDGAVIALRRSAAAA